MPNTANLALPYPSLTDAPNVPQHIQDLAGAIDTRLGGAWVAWTPTIGGSTGFSSFGNATFEGAWKDLGNKTAVFRFVFVAGSTTTYAAAGTAMSFGPLPFNLAAIQIATALFYRNTSTNAAMSAYLTSNTINRFYGANSVITSSNTPAGAWTAGDLLRVTGLVQTL